MTVFCQAYKAILTWEGFSSSGPSPTSPSLAALQHPELPLCPSDTLCSLPPQGLCTCCSLSGNVFSPTPSVPNLSRLRSRLRADWELNGESIDASLVISGSMLPPQGTQVRSLVKELRSYMPCGTQNLFLKCSIYFNTAEMN